MRHLQFRGPATLGMMLGLAFGSPLVGQQLDAKKIYRQTVRATVNVRGAKIGTGWLFDRDKKLLITSAFDVGTEKSVKVAFPQFKGGKLIAEREFYDKDAKEIAGEVIARDTKRDLALVRLESIPENAVALKLAADSPPAGERLHAVFNTNASQGMWGYSTGIVRQVYRKKEAHNGATLDARVIVSQLPINPGDSGGPVVNEAGELVGVAIGVVEKTRLVTFCTDVTEVRDFIAKAKIALDDIGDQRLAATRQRGAAPETAGSATQDAPNTYQKLLAGSVWIVPTRQPKDAGTGCLVDRKRKLVLTTLKIVGDDETTRVWFPVFADGDVIGERDHYRNKLEPIQARIVHREPRCGLAVLELESLPESVKELKLAEHGAEPTDEIQTIGNPVYTTGLWIYHRGTVRQVYQCKARPKASEFNARILETQSPYNPGDAGGPVVNIRGELVGIVDSAVPGTQYVTYCIDISEIREILQSVTVGKEKLP